MAKVKILGNAVEVTSSVKFEDIKKVKKYRPSALVLKDENGNALYALSVGEGKINNVGASFDHATRDDEKKATLTMAVTYEGDDVKAYVADALGAALLNLGKIEATLPAVINEINQEQASVESLITVL